MLGRRDGANPIQITNAQMAVTMTTVAMSAILRMVPRGKGAANLSGHPKTEGTAAVGWSEWAQRPGARDAMIATATLSLGSLQRFDTPSKALWIF